MSRKALCIIHNALGLVLVVGAILLLLGATRAN